MSVCDDEVNKKTHLLRNDYCKAGNIKYILVIRWLIHEYKYAPMVTAIVGSGLRIIEIPMRAIFHVHPSPERMLAVGTGGRKDTRGLSITWYSAVRSGVIMAQSKTETVGYLADSYRFQKKPWRRK